MIKLMQPERALDERLAELGQRLARPWPPLAVLDAPVPCCDAADAVIGSTAIGCPCCR